MTGNTALPRPHRLPDPEVVRAGVASHAARAWGAATYYAWARPRRHLEHVARLPRQWRAQRATRPRWAAVQGQSAYATVQRIADDCLMLTSGQRRAVLDVDGIGWRRLAEDEQDALIDSHAWLLNSLTHPVQWSVLTRTTDLEAQALGLEHRADVAEAAGVWPPELLRFVRDKAAFLREDGARRRLKRRRYLLTIPSELLLADEAAGELTERATALLEQLGRLGITGRRLTTPELGALVFETWQPGILGSGGGQVPLVASEDEWAYAAGQLTLPGQVERHGDDLRVLGEVPGQEWWSRTLVLSWWPSQVVGLWLWPLIECREAIDLTLHLTPLDDQERKEHHRTRQEHLEMARQFFANKLPLPGRELATTHTAMMTNALEEGMARAFNVSVYALLRAPSQKGLDELQRRAQREIKGLLARSRRARAEPDLAFQACRPEGTDALGVVREHDTWALAHSFPACTAGLTMDTPGASLWGYDGDQAVIWDRFDPSLKARGDLNSCQVILAPPGAGKSTYLKRQIPDELARGVAVTVFDVEGEYTPLLELLGPAMAQDIVPDGTTGDCLNAFELPPHDPEASGRQRNPVHAQTLAIKGLLGVALGHLIDEEAAMVDHAVLATYAAEPWCITPGDPFSWRAPQGVPDMASLSEQLLRLAAEAPRERDRETAGALTSRLRPFVTGSLAGIFTGTQTVSLDKPFVRFNLAGVDDELYPLVSYLCSTWLWTEQRRRPRKRLFIADEAWRWGRYRPLRLFMQDLARRGRKWLLAPVFVFHSGDDFEDDDTRAVLECSAMQYVMRQTARSIDATAKRFNLSRGDRQFLLSAQKGEGLFYARGTHVALTLGPPAPCEAPLVLTGLQAESVRDTHQAEKGESRQLLRPKGRSLPLETHDVAPTAPHDAPPRRSVG